MSDELQIFLKDVKEKFDIIIEGIYMIIEKLDRHIEESRKKREKFEMGLLEFQRDMNEHRDSTELHGGRAKKEAS